MVYLTGQFNILIYARQSQIRYENLHVDLILNYLWVFSLLSHIKVAL